MNTEAGRLAMFLRARVDESGKSLRELGAEVDYAPSVVSTYLSGKIPPEKLVSALIRATVPPQLRERREAEARELRQRAIHPPRQAPAASAVGGQLLDVAAVQTKHLETYEHLTRAMEQQAELRQAAANSEKLVWVLYGMVGKLQERVALLSGERDQLVRAAGEGAAAAERTLARAVDQQERAETELERARDKQREAEELATRLQARIDAMAEELNRLRSSAQHPQNLLPDVMEPARSAKGEDPEGDDIEAALLRAEAVNDLDADMVDRIADAIDQSDPLPAVVPDNASTSPNIKYKPWQRLAVQGLAAAKSDRPAEAARLFGLAVETATRLDSKDPDAFDVRYQHAHWTGLAGDVTKARDLLEHLVADFTDFFGPHHGDTLTARRDHAHWTGEAGNTAMARDLMQELIPDYARVYRPNHSRVLALRHEHAGWTGLAGNAPKASGLLQHLITDRTRALGPEHSDTLTTRHDHAHWTGQAGEAAKARDLLTKVATDRARVLGPDHADTLSSVRQLAHQTGQAGDAAQARDLFAGLVADVTHSLEHNHPVTLAIRHEHAHWTGQAGDAAKARDLLTKVVADRTRLLGPEHTDTLSARHSQAHWTGEAGDAVSARDRFTNLVADRSRLLGPEHTDTKKSMRDHSYWTVKARR
ncbi:tetratricopeptide repeat protein [Streptomyces goshikiensis]